MATGYDVITIGAATIDTFVWSKAFRTVRSSAFPTGIGECFSLGSKIDIDRLEIATGGGATNAAATFANLKMKTATLASVGDDIFGAGVREDLKKRGIGTSLIRELPGERTAFSTILLVPSGERTILVARGASERLMPKDVPWRALRAKWFYMTSFGGNIALARAVLAHAKKRGIRTFWNPGGKDLAHGVGVLRPLFRMVDVLDMNREEASAFTGRPLHDLFGMVQNLKKCGECLVLLTDGEKGAYLAENGHFWFARSHPKIKAVNRTGAGDAFGSGFLAGLIKYKDRTRALQTGMLNAEGVIQKIGAKTGILMRWPSKKELHGVKVSAV